MFNLLRRGFLLAGYTRSIPSESQYLTSTAVIVGEMMKVAVSLILILRVVRTCMLSVLGESSGQANHARAYHFDIIP